MLLKSLAKLPVLKAPEQVLKAPEQVLEASEQVLEASEQVFKTCSDAFHHNHSNYEKDKVPIEEFRKKGKSDTDLYKRCNDCRGYSRNLEREKKKKRDELIEKNKNNLEFSTCSDSKHTARSKYPIDKVPKSNFLPESNRSSDKPYKTCSDCRSFNRIKNKEETEKRISKIKVSEGNFLCKGCDKEKPLEELSQKVNGEGLNTRCKDCQKKARDYNVRHYKELKDIYRKIQLEYILKNQASCELCKSIFLIPEPGTQFCIELKTREENGERYVDYKNKTYLVKNFLDEFVDLLEYRVLDFDHLPEKEARERGFLMEDEPYVSKLGSVLSLPNEKEMRKESKKCQFIDCKCHLKVTISREEGKKSYTAGRIEKINYINDIKRQGCSICGFFEEDLLRFIEMDHIDPNTKRTEISDLVLYDKYPLEDVVIESRGCRPLCKFCHRIHSSWQLENGII